MLIRGPPGGLEMLRIVNYRGSKVPTWVKDLSLFQQYLTELHLVGCTMCEEFPDFSHFRALQVLHLIWLYKLQPSRKLLLFLLSGILEHIAMVKANLNRSMWEQGNYTIIKVVAACLKMFSNRDLVLQKYETADIFNRLLHIQVYKYPLFARY